jgi:hypothetical protein
MTTPDLYWVEVGISSGDNFSGLATMRWNSPHVEAARTSAESPKF